MGDESAREGGVERACQIQRDNEVQYGEDESKTEPLRICRVRGMTQSYIWDL